MNGFWHKQSRLTDLISFLDQITGRDESSEGVEICYGNVYRATGYVNQKLLDQKVKAFEVDAKVNNRQKSEGQVFQCYSGGVCQKEDCCTAGCPMGVS